MKALTAAARSVLYQEAIKIDRNPISAGDCVIFQRSVGHRLVIYENGEVEVWKENDPSTVEEFFRRELALAKRSTPTAPRKFNVSTERIQQIMKELEEA
jgi:hypothetical protein